MAEARHGLDLGAGHLGADELEVRCRLPCGHRCTFVLFVNEGGLQQQERFVHALECRREHLRIVAHHGQHEGLTDLLRDSERAAQDSINGFRIAGGCEHLPEYAAHEIQILAGSKTALESSIRVREEPTTVEEDNGGHALRCAQSRLQHHAAAHAVADEDGWWKAERLHQGRYLSAAQGDAGRLGGWWRGSVAWQINGYRHIPRGEVLDLCQPVTGTAAEAVHENDWWQSAAGNKMVDQSHQCYLVQPGPVATQTPGCLRFRPAEIRSLMNNVAPMSRAHDESRGNSLKLAAKGRDEFPYC